MGRSKRAAPKKLDASKRQCLEWNMQDLQHDVVIVDDDDPALLEEQLQAGLKSSSALGFGMHQMSDAEITRLTESSEACLTLHNKLSFKATEWHCEIASFVVTLTLPVSPDQISHCEYFWFYVNEDPDHHLLYVERPACATSSTSKLNADIYQARCAVPISVLLGLQGRAFVIENTGLSGTELSLKIHLSESGLTKLHFSSEGYHNRKVNSTLQPLMQYFHGFSYPSYTGKTFTTKHNIDELYEEIRRRHLEQLPSISINPQHPSLKPRLRPYQQDAVLWMLSREKYNQQNQQDPNGLHDLYQEFVSPDGQLFYYNRHGGMMVKEKPLAQPTPLGGVLADEMGLGKTVEVLACMLCHPRTDLPPVEPMATAIIEDEEPQHDEILKAEEASEPGTSAMATDIPVLTVKLEKEQQQVGPQLDPEVASPKSLNDVAEQDQALETSTTDTKTEVKTIVETPHMNMVSLNTVNKDIPDTKEEESAIEEKTDPVETGGCFDDHNYAQHLEDIVSEEVAIGDTVAEEVVIGDTLSGEVLIGDTVSEQVVIGDTGAAVSLTCVLCGTQASSSAAAAASAAAMSLQASSSSFPDISFTCDKCLQLQESSVQKPKKKGKAMKKQANTKRSEEKSGKKRGKKCSDSKPLAKSKKTMGKTKAKEAQRTTGRKRLTRRSKSSTTEASDDTASCSKNTAKAAEKVNPAKRQSYKPSFKLIEEEDCALTFSEQLSKPAPQQQYLECVCGATGQHRKDSLKVQCCMCGQWQHADCVHYDLTDPCRGIYKCPHCHVASAPIPSGATLIISPSSISYQWVEEIRKHIHQQDIKMLVYAGVHKAGFVQPQTLANHDIVIVSYETLRKEIDYVDLPHSNSEEGRRFRHPKRFMAIPSPIIAVEWWRICLDEAQMVECTTTKTAEMALRLAAVNRWCVSGTPIQRGIQDLFGLLLFLRADPYWVQTWWTKLLYEPYCHGHKEPLYQTLAKVLWRTSKKHILDQICLPGQMDTVQWLTFTPVEEHFYRSQYQRCSNQVSQSLRKCPGTDATLLNTLDRYTLHMLLNPMTSLRQACCHPNAVRGEFRTINKSNLTMEELLVSLTKKARLECEEAHRQYVFANNALAAICIINGKPVEGVEKYREVLRSAEEHKAEFRTDELQMLHTLHNLQEVLSTKPAGVPPTLRDDQLADQCKDIKEKYLTKAAAFVKSTEEALAPVAASLRQIEQQFRGQANWWLELLGWITRAELDQALVIRVKDDLTDNTNYDMDTIVRRFRDIRGLQYVLATQLDELQSSRDKVLQTVQKLSGEPSRDLISTTTECCLRPVNPEVVLKTCPFCKADEKFEDYENKLFFFVDKGILGGGEEEAEEDENVKKATRFFVATKRKGTWADSQTEKALKSILSFCKMYKANKALLQSGAFHMKIFEELKKEYKLIHRVFMALKENVATYDELDMATTRLRLRLPEEPVPEVPQPNVLEPMELEAQKLKFNSDRIISSNELKKKLGQLLYLKNLAKTQDSLQDGKNPELCPVCQGQLGTRWSVMQCGHCFCFDCIEIMMDRYPGFGGRNSSMKCPVCRQMTPFANISYVSTRAADVADEDAIKVKGDHSTKVVGVVRCLLEIKKDDPQAKSLVFSSWQGVLDILSKALDDNDIKYKSLMWHNKFQNNLWNFKQNEDIKVLLLPVHSGANGLNLIEATHVLLVEPILNPAQELQAIGRVHRIGQTKPTFVHRFIVKGTIEERMHRLLSTAQAPTNSHNSEETTMTLGDLKSLFKEAPLSNTSDEVQDAADTGNQVPQAGQAGAGNSTVSQLTQDTVSQEPQPRTSNSTVNQHAILGNKGGLAGTSNSPVSQLAGHLASQEPQAGTSNNTVSQHADDTVSQEP